MDYGRKQKRAASFAGMPSPWIGIIENYFRCGLVEALGNELRVEAG
jgi:hypothetical protein